MTQHSRNIHTPRLKLVASSIEHLLCELNSPEKLGGLLDAEVPSSWPPGFYDRDAMQFFLENAQNGGDAIAGWNGWYAMRHAAESTRPRLVASAGYFGPPSTEGIVEIGYSVVPEERAQGFATEMVQALVKRALEDSRVKQLVAEAADTNVGSIKVLARCAFVKIGPGRDEGHSRYELR